MGIEQCSCGGNPKLDRRSGSWSCDNPKCDWFNKKVCTEEWNGRKEIRKQLFNEYVQPESKIKLKPFEGLKYYEKKIINKLRNVCREIFKEFYADYDNGDIIILNKHTIIGVGHSSYGGWDSLSENIPMLYDRIFLTDLLEEDVSAIIIKGKDSKEFLNCSRHFLTGT